MNPFKILLAALLPILSVADSWEIVPSNFEQSPYFSVWQSMPESELFAPHVLFDLSVYQTPYFYSQPYSDFDKIEYLKKLLQGSNTTKLQRRQWRMMLQSYIQLQEVQSNEIVVASSWPMQGSFVQAKPSLETPAQHKRNEGWGGCDTSAQPETSANETPAQQSPSPKKALRGAKAQPVSQYRI